MSNYTCRYCQMPGSCWIHTDTDPGDGDPDPDMDGGPDADRSWDMLDLGLELDLEEETPNSYDPGTDRLVYVEPHIQGNMHTYQSWYQFIRSADTVNNLNPARRSSRETGNRSWAGTRDWDETMHLATRGWPEGLRRIKEQIRIIEQFVSPKQPRLELTHAIRGPGILDLERYQQGCPDAWVVWQEEKDQQGRSTKIVPIVFNVAASSGVDTNTLFRRGAAICAMIDVLEHQGIRCEVTIVESCTYRMGAHMDGNNPIFKVMLKQAGDVLDMDRMAFALCNASVLRRLMFSMKEQYVPHLGMDYGYPATYREEDALNLDAGSLAIRNEADMVPWMLKQLASYGVEVE